MVSDTCPDREGNDVPDRRNDHSASFDPTTKLVISKVDKIVAAPTREEAALLSRLDYEGNRDDEG